MLRDVFKHFLHEPFAEQVRARARDAALAPPPDLHDVPERVGERFQSPAVVPGEERLVQDDEVEILRRVCGDRGERDERDAEV